jgi:hypothetical protein
MHARHCSSCATSRSRSGAVFAVRDVNLLIYSAKSWRSSATTGGKSTLIKLVVGVHVGWR